jgi:hypothetical protein
MPEPPQLRRIQKSGAAMRASERAMMESEADMKKRHKLTNGELLRRYMDRQTSARKKQERATLKVLRASAYLSRARTELLYIQRTMQEISDAITRGEVFPVRKEKKPKRGRRIEL